MQAELTQEETTALHHLKQRQVVWHRNRWAYLALSLAMLSAGIFFDSKFSSLPPVHSIDPVALGYHFQIVSAASSGRTLAYLFSLAGFFGALSVVARWRGNPSTRLLLALARRLERLERSDAAPAVE